MVVIIRVCPVRAFGRRKRWRCLLGLRVVEEWLVAELHGGDKWLVMMA